MLVADRDLMDLTVTELNDELKERRLLEEDGQQRVAAAAASRGNAARPPRRSLGRMDAPPAVLHTSRLGLSPS